MGARALPRFAANLSFLFCDRPFLDRFAAAAAHGFEAVEFLFPYDHAPEIIAATLRETGLTLALFNAPPGDWEAGERGLAALPGREAEQRASVMRALDYAEATSCRRIHLMAGLAPREDAAARARYREALEFASGEAAERGVDITIEPINGRDMPGYHLDDFDYAAALIREIGRPNLKLQFDVYHRQILRGDVIRGLESLAPLIGHVQIASVPDRSEPGTGELDDFRIFAILDRLGYDGFVGCEYRPAAGAEAGFGWRAALGRDSR